MLFLVFLLCLLPSENLRQHKVWSECCSNDREECTGETVCRAMSEAFIRDLNSIRRRKGLGELKEDPVMLALLTEPHNRWQLQRGDISHGHGARSMSRRADRAGFGRFAIGECVAMRSFDRPDFVAQYRGSPPHWKLLTDVDFRFIAVSTLYDPGSDTYYSAVNLR